MKQRVGLILIVCAAVCAAFVGTHRGAGQGDAAATSVAAPGYRIYIDAATGGIVSEPNGTAPVVLDPGVQNALSTSAEGLVETPSPVPGGGVMVELDGRFQNAMMATVDGGGEMTAPCVSGLPGEGPGAKERP
jgi:hypothetical protein